MKQHSSISNQKELSRKETKPARRESREVMAELVTQLRKQLDAEGVAAPLESEGVPDGEKPNLDRLTVGVDLGDQWSNYCILGLGGETLTEGQFNRSDYENLRIKLQESCHYAPNGRMNASAWSKK